MLLEFSVSNFKSFKDKQTISFIKGKGDELPDNIFEVNTLNKSINILKTSVIYGANASGKSNLLSALKAMEEIVIYSASTQAEESLAVTPFKLNTNTINEPSEFEVIFIVDGTRYQYGFSVDKKRIFEEWLFAYPKGHPQKWFHRVWDKETEEEHWYLGNFLTGEKQVWKNSTRKNALFLSTAVQLNSKQLQPLFSWFKTTLRFSSPRGWDHEYTAMMCDSNDSNNKNKVMNFLKSADLNVSDIKTERKNLKDVVINDKDMPEELKALILKNGDLNTLEVKLGRTNNSGKNIYFDFDEESDGTKKFFSIIGPWIDVLNKGYVLLVDELHNSLHPNLVKLLISLFHDKTINNNNAQLIFTTHETSVLNQKIFRRDQIWFCSKEKEYSTKVYPLSDFSPRKGYENLEDAYLSGRYGGLPFISSNLLYGE